MSRMSVRQLRDGLEPFLGVPAGAFDREAALPAFLAFREALERGAVRAATRDEAGTWNVHVWVKEGLLLGFRLGRLERQGGDPQPFFDKDTYPVRALTLADQIRVVPGGSAIRTAAYVAPGVVCMPPMYVNVGAYVGEGTMIDSHALVGTCAQVGRRVHLSAAAQLGGVIEPPGALPVIVEDDAFIGGGCGVYEGCIIRAGAVLSAGVILTRSTRVYDLVHERILTRNAAGVLDIPERAVVIPGSRPASGSFAAEHGLHVSAPLIVKYRDARTDAATALEEAVR